MQINGAMGLMDKTEIFFLGSGGGRFSMITQRRHTGGIRFLNPMNIQLDPGPGAIVYSNQMNLSPLKVEALLISHAHPDHYSDGEIFIEAMTDGMTRKKGYLIAPRSVIRGAGKHDPCISNYHRNMVKKIFEVKPGDRIDLAKIEVEVTKAKHTDPSTVGFKFKFPAGHVAYIPDTEYFEGMENQYGDIRILIVSVLRPRGTPIRGHLCSDDAVEILNKIKPEISILTNFGMRMIYMNPNSEARFVEEKTGIKTIAAYDNMRLEVGNQIKIINERPSLERFF